MESITQEGYIVKVYDSGHVQFSLSYSNSDFNNKKIKIDQVRFRNDIAPKSLITENAKVILKIQNNKLIECCLDPHLEINATFGIISSINFETQSIGIDDGFSLILYKFKQLFDLKKNLDGVQSGTPILLYFNGDSVIEAKIIHDNWTKMFKLDYFLKDRTGRELTEFVILKDQSFISHKIYKNNIFYKNTTYPFNLEKISQSIGEDVEISCKSKKIYAEVKLEITLNSLKVYREKEELQNQRKSKSLPKSVYFNNPTPQYGARSRLFEGNNEWYYKENLNLEEKGIVLLSLIEACFRTKDEKLCTVLRSKLAEAAIINNSDQFIEELFIKIKSNQNETKNLEELYCFAFQKSAELESLSKFIIKDSRNFALLAQIFNICFYVFSDNQWVVYRPLFFKNSLTYVYLKASDGIQILYTQTIMRIDGYDLESLSYSIPCSENLNQLYLQQLPQDQTPDLQNIFEAYHELQNYISHKDASNEGQLARLNNSFVSLLQRLSSKLDINNPEETEKLYEKVLSVEFAKNNKLLCLCGEEADGLKYCKTEHFLCKKCVFISNSCKFCAFCKQPFPIESSFDSFSCQSCMNVFKQDCFYKFPCMCILCFHCVYYLLNAKSELCFQGHQLECKQESLSYFQSLGYFQ